MQAPLEITLCIMALCIAVGAIWALSSVFLVAAVHTTQAPLAWQGWVAMLVSFVLAVAVGAAAHAIWDVIWWRIDQL